MEQLSGIKIFFTGLHIGLSRNIADSNFNSHVQTWSMNCFDCASVDLFIFTLDIDINGVTISSMQDQTSNSPDAVTEVGVKKFSLDDLCTLSDTSKRTVRYYMQIGLVDPPHGATKAAHYLHKHLDQLLTIRKLSDAGVSLVRIREVLSGELPPLPPRQRQPGSVEVRSHLFIADGVELEISPEQSGLSPEQVRTLVRAVMQAYKDLKGESK